jgi:hypothetical protein
MIVYRPGTVWHPAAPAIITEKPSGTEVKPRKEAESDLIRRSPIRHNRMPSGGSVRSVTVRSVMG